jgi:hypothetical protein
MNPEATRIEMPNAPEGETLMLREAREAPEAVSRLLAENTALCRELGARLRAAPPPFAVTCARGSSDNAATFVTDTRERMAEAIDAACAALRMGVTGALGIHLEGPFLNPDRKGAHDPKYMRPIEGEDLRLMTSLGTGRTRVP